MTVGFPQIKVRHQATDPGRSENTKQDKCQKTLPRHIIFKLQKIKEKILQEARRMKNTLPIGGAKMRITATLQKLCKQESGMKY